MFSPQPRGIRNNNPGNLEWGSPWQGLVPFEERTDDRFCQFTNPSWGIRALARTLITYQDKRRAADGSVIDTVVEVIERWAPRSENHTDRYIIAVCADTGFAPNQELDMHNYAHIRPLVEAIIKFECGSNGPLSTPNGWYSVEQVDQGLRLAGIVDKSAHVASIPVTKETVSATALVSVGASQVVEALPQINSAIGDAQTHLSAGTVVGMVCGVLSLTIAGILVWSQVQKYKQGLVE